MIAGIIASTARLIVGANVQWVEPPSQKPTIYIANHSSHLDFVVLWACLPTEVRRKTHPVAAKDYWSTGIKKYLATHVFKALLVDRAGSAKSALVENGEKTVNGNVDAYVNEKKYNPNGVENMISLLDNGDSIILFPAGTRNDEENMKFKSGLYNVCLKRPHINVVPVYLENLNRVLPKGSILPVPLLCEVTMGNSFKLESGEERIHFLERAKNAIMELKQ